MKRLAFLALLAATPATAQIYVDTNRSAVPEYHVDPVTGLPAPSGSAANPVYTSQSPSSGSATAANQQTQITAEQAIQANQTNGNQVAYANPVVTPSVGTMLSAYNSAVSGSLIVKTTGGNLYSVNVVSGATAGYVMVLNTNVVPADGSVIPTKCIPLAANSGIELRYAPVPEAFPAGIVVVFSSTGCFTKTISNTAYIVADAK